MLTGKAFIVAVLLGVVAVWSIRQVTHSESVPQMKAEGSRNAAPDFALKDADNKTVSLADYRGKVVLLNFWATWCPPCKVEIPWFIEFEKQYKDQGFAVLGVSLDEAGWEAVKPYIESSRINYPVLMGDATIDQTYGPIETLPTTFLVDREGRIAAVHTSLPERAEYEAQIQELLRTAAR
jgi:cytochrome c biogenesis protein CcmG/thiol:disulfide interchange protein DsbE